jgi:hypothetical protein
MERDLFFSDGYGWCSNCSWRMETAATEHLDFDDYAQARDYARARWVEHQCEDFPFPARS